MEHSDILVVGAGSAGAALAARVSEEPTLRVTLVEGRHRVRVWAPAGGAPPAFERVAPTLEDAYLVLMRNDAALGEANGSARAAGGTAVVEVRS